MAIAATAPAFAASTQRTTITPAAPVKWSNAKEKHVSWDIKIENGPVAIQAISIKFTYLPKSGGPFDFFEIYGYPPTPTPRDITWTGAGPAPATGTITTTHGPIAEGATYLLHTDFAGGDNAAGTVTAEVTITYAGAPTSAPVQTFGPTSWGSGNQHTHPGTAP